MGPFGSLYDILQVPPHARLDEIKLAFRKRALQVHPDKGGSKDAFHQVYHALEVLSNPEARKSYDRTLGAKEPSKAPKGKKVRQRDQQHGPKPGKQTKSAAVFQKLMMRIQQLLKQLPREVRFQTIRQDFSQKQRVLLQKWMEAERDREEKGTEAPRVETEVSAVKRSRRHPASRKSLAMPTANKFAGQPRSELKSSRNGSGTRGVCRRNSGQGNARYRAHVCIDGVSIYSTTCDLPTALEYLVILTSAKQKALGKSDRLEDSLQQELTACSHEQGIDLKELKLRFAVSIHQFTMLIGRYHLQSPIVHSLEDVKTLRNLLEPLTEGVKHCKGVLRSRNIFEFFSPDDLQKLWQNFQSTVAQMFAAAGVSTSSCLRRIQAWHDANDRRCTKHLQNWELAQMAANDSKKKRQSFGTTKSAKVRKSNDPVEQLVGLRKLLKRWDCMLVQEEQRREKLRRRLQQRKKGFAKQTQRKRGSKRES